MWRRALLVIALSPAGCSFNPARDVAVDAAVAGEDASVDATVDGAPDDAPAIAPCETPDGDGLVLCLELEDGVADGTLVDSSPRHHDATASGLSEATRDVPQTSTAAQIGAGASTRIAETADLDRDAAYTLAMWIHPDTSPEPGDVQGLLDHEQQYAMLIGHRDAPDAIEVRCAHTDVDEFEFTDDLPLGSWSFVACTWDGTELCAVRWSSAADAQRFCHVAFAPQAAGVQGLAIGHLSEDGEAHSRFAGALDSVQIYDRALTVDALCALIGEPAGCLP